MKFFFGLIIIFVSIYNFSCKRPKIEITSEYIINENWSERGEQVGANAIKISKMKVKSDSILNPFLKPNQADLLNKLETDSSFIYYTNVTIKPGETYNDKKIYFNKDNGFKWLNGYTGDKIEILGNLNRTVWYEFSGIRHSPSYIYIDSTNNVYRFDVNTANY